MKAVYLFAVVFIFGCSSSDNDLTLNDESNLVTSAEPVDTATDNNPVSQSSIVNILWNLESLITRNGVAFSFDERSYSFSLSSDSGNVMGTLRSCLAVPLYIIEDGVLSFRFLPEEPPPCPLPEIDANNYNDFNLIVERDILLGNALQNSSFVFVNDNERLTLTAQDGLTIIALRDIL